MLKVCPLTGSNSQGKKVIPMKKIKVRKNNKLIRRIIPILLTGFRMLALDNDVSVNLSRQ